MGQLFSPEQSHERIGKRKHSLVKPFDGAFSTDRIAQEYDHKVNYVVMAKPASGETYPLFNCRQHAYVPKIMCDYSHFPEPGRG